MKNAIDRSHFALWHVSRMVHIRFYIQQTLFTLDLPHSAQQHHNSPLIMSTLSMSTTSPQAPGFPALRCPSLFSGCAPLIFLFYLAGKSCLQALKVFGSMQCIFPDRTGSQQRFPFLNVYAASETFFIGTSNFTEITDSVRFTSLLQNGSYNFCCGNGSLFDIL